MYSLKLAKEEQLKEEVIKSAQILFHQFGFYKTTMEDIAKSMGRGKSTLYQHFKSKEEVLEVVIMKEIDEVIEKTNQACEKAITAEDKLITFFSFSLKELKNKMILYKIMSGDKVENYVKDEKLIKRYKLKEIQSVKNILLLGINNKEFTSSLEEDLDLFAYFVVSSIRSITNDLLIENEFHNLDERLNRLLKLFFIKALKG